MRIVVRGADGAIGRGVSARLVSLGHDVVGVGARRPESWSGAVEFVVAEHCDSDVVAGADAVLRCGGTSVAPHYCVEHSGGSAIVVRTALVLGRHVDDAVLRRFTAPVILDDGTFDRPL